MAVPLANPVGVPPPNTTKKELAGITVPCSKVCLVLSPPLLPSEITNPLYQNQNLYCKIQ